MNPTPKSEKHGADNSENQTSTNQLVGSGLPGSSGHKASFRSTKLARRARSFKEDILEKFSQIRSPGMDFSHIVYRSHSPKSRFAYGLDKGGNYETEKNPNKELECLVRQVTVSLKHFRDVVSKNKLEMLPGNGTIVLETVTAIHTALKQYVLEFTIGNHHNTALGSATKQVYQCLARLIKLCDDALLFGDQSDQLKTENVCEVVSLVEEAILTLVKLAKEKISIGRKPAPLQPRSAYGSGGNGLLSNYYTKLSNPSTPSASSNSDSTFDLPTTGSQQQRNSLPDIPLTPRERQILEQSTGVLSDSSRVVRNSHSTESILRDTHLLSSQLDNNSGVNKSYTPSPPPKPPLPENFTLSSAYVRIPESDSYSNNNNCGTPPPIPPKKRQNQRTQQIIDESCSNSSDNSLLGLSLDRISLRSKSPEDSCPSSLLSASAGSLDSVLNQSKEDEEIRALMIADDSLQDDSTSDTTTDIVSQGTNGVCTCNWDNSVANNIPQLNDTINLQSSPQPINNQPPCREMHRLSSNTAESGISSVRSSFQSFSATSMTTSSGSKRSSTSHQQHSNTSSLIIKTSPVGGDNNVVELSEKLKLIENFQNKLSPLGSNDISIPSLDRLYHNEKLSESKMLQKTSDELIMTTKATTITNVVTHKNMSTLLNNLSLDVTDNLSMIDADDDQINDETPPKLPQKMRTLKYSVRRERRPSEYDNVFNDGDHLITCSRHQQQLLDPNSSLEIMDNGRPPPLPPKKKHMFQSVAYSVMAYMEMFGNCSHSGNDFLRHSMHTYNLMQTEWPHEGEMTNTSDIQMMSTTQSCSFSISSQTSNFNSLASDCSFSTLNSNYQPAPPALPPKRNKINSKQSPSLGGTPQKSPINDKSPTNNIENKLTPHCYRRESSISPINRDDNKLTPIHAYHRDSISPISSSQQPSPSHQNNSSTTSTYQNQSSVDRTNSYENHTVMLDCLSELDVYKFLVFKSPEEDGPDLRGGHPDALIIYATKPQKNDFKYQEAFLTTYRTFLSPLELVNKLIYRHQRLSCQRDKNKQRAAKESFSLLVSVVSDLTITDLDNQLLQALMDFVYDLICNGDLTMAKALRIKTLEKYELKRQNKLGGPMMNLTSTPMNQHRHSTLLDFKSEQIAEQMTLLDSQLFVKIEIPEVLIWAQEQNEERSPNLTCFTEHFNKMSYWARTQVLEQKDGKDREKYVIKFIKIMKYLRKINNFNSYLALLSALDSAPIRRLEWQKHIIEGLKDYCTLIDSSSSFRAYRQALAEAQPPCIPYIGLVLQDLTFVHIGNNDLLPDGSINFSKRWQQFNIVENMKRFKKCTYQFKKIDRIIQFFNNFDDFLPEEKMWQISESIKPRGSGRKVT